EACDRQVRLERGDLAAERVAPDGYVDEPEMVAVEHDHPRARPEHRAVEAADPLIQAVQGHQPRERRRLAPRNHQAVEAVELICLPDLDNVCAKAAQHLRVLAKVSLHGENADPERLHASMVSPGLT